VPDPERTYGEVVLAQEIARPRVGPPFEWHDGSWRLDFPRCEVDRMEYLLGIDGAFQPDPGNPLRAPGPFGEKSVVEWPEYEPPAWLDSVADAGPVVPLEIRCRRLVARVHVLLYATPDPPGIDAPLLVAHDGPE
jgi:enterochelin esterase family protein